MSKSIKLSKWSCPEIDPFKAPEGKSTYLVGYLPSGKRVLTSAVVSCTGVIARTQSGTLYDLSDPDPKYIEWMKENNIEFDIVNPVKFKDKK